MLTLIIIAIATFVATFLGGFIAIKYKDKLHLILGFSAGAVIAVALFDLLPEALELGAEHYAASTITAVAALGFLVYLILDRAIFLHCHADEEHGGSRGSLGAGTLSIHSFIDGVAIGLAFQISSAVGAIVAVAVLVHDFSDGINTVGLILKNQGDKKRAYSWLFVDALAPVVGIICTTFFSLSEATLAIVLAAFSGFFLYISASDLIPESHHAHPKMLTTVMTLLGAAVLFLAIQFAR